MDDVFCTLSTVVFVSTRLLTADIGLGARAVVGWSRSWVGDGISTSGTDHRFACMCYAVGREGAFLAVMILLVVVCCSFAWRNHAML